MTRFGVFCAGTVFGCLQMHMWMAWHDPDWFKAIATFLGLLAVGLMMAVQENGKMQK